ncbi:DUF92 domain-containing protein [Desulfosporosinus sp. FKB]|uniref:DUF92 domain-containing protein n=1 Tax=Desulfosporosinus sp. FKB TaxID=1969835 RepID=UPI000B4A5444|nr:DUF92 domain-containing protein [Desulfosporosinus sp. FKB]
MLFDTLWIDISVIVSIIAICILAYKAKALTLLGAVFALFLTVGIYSSGGIPFLAALLGFFIASSFFTKFRAKEKEELEKALYEKGGNRDHVQVLANGGAAFIIAAAHFLMPDKQLYVAYFVAIAACNADSWASEIGIMSKATPFSIINLKPVQKGMSGGVTFLGLFASACGALFIAGIYTIFMFVHFPFLELIRNCTIIAIFGFAGAAIDSALGLLFQPAYVDSTGKLTEKRADGRVKNKKVKGFEFFGNDMVNFVSSLVAAGLAYCAITFL